MKNSTNDQSISFSAENVNRIVFNPPRPQINDEIKYTAALKLAKDNPELNEELSPEEIATIIVEIAVDCCSRDGYYLAKKLDDVYMWDIDAQSVEILDNYDHLVDAELKKAQKEWVKTNNIQPPFSIGTKVTFKWCYEKHVGVIEKISDFDPAFYLIKTDLKTESKTITYVKKAFEDCWLAENDEGAQNYE